MKRQHLLLVLFVLLSPAATSAAPQTPADALIDKGNAFRLKDQHQEALECFLKANALAPSGRTVAQIGLAEASLHRWVDAESHLRVALGSHDSPWTENTKTRELLQKTLVFIRSHISLVNVIGPAGTDVTVNGRPAGRLPLVEPLHLAEGQVRMEGTALGRQSAAADLTVVGGREMTLRLDLPPALPVAAPVVHQPAPLIEDTSGVADSRPWKSWTGAGLLVVSAAAIATGVVWLAVDGNTTCSPAPPAGARCSRLYDTKAQGWIAVGVGAAAGALGGVLFWQGHHGEAARMGLGLGTFNAAATF